MKLAAIILAAGASTRMGSPKQLLTWRGMSLIEKAVSATLIADVTIVVVGASASLIRDELNRAGPPAMREVDSAHRRRPGSVLVIDHPAWSAGMGSSIKAGFAAVSPLDPDAVLVLLCDQPYVDAAAVRLLVDAVTDKSITAAGYSGVVGVPAVFRRPAFPLLENLPDDVGARRILSSRPEWVHVVPMPAAAVDVDTPEDFEGLP